MHGAFRTRFERLNTKRSFFTNIVPNYTITDVEKPVRHPLILPLHVMDLNNFMLQSCYLRKFTPDGKRFIAFSQDQTHLEIYEYLGPAGGLSEVDRVTKLLANSPKTGHKIY